MALVNKDAAVMVKDADAAENLMREACRLVTDSSRIAELEKNIALLARTDAAMDIAKEVYRIAR